MAKIKKLKTENKIDSKTYLISDINGEIVPTNDKTVIIREDAGIVNFNYKNYVTIDTDALKQLVNTLSDANLSLILKLCTTLRITENICFQENKIPHTTSSLAELFNETHQSMKRKLNELMKHNLLVYVYSETYRCTVYIMNPHLVKNGKNFPKELTEKFNPIILISSSQTNSNFQQE
jgi:hypothetical protein